MIVTSYPLSHYINKLEGGVPFCFVRYGDGEFQAMKVLPTSHKQNCDGHIYFPELATDLVETLKTNEPNFIRSTGSIATKDDGKSLIEAFLRENKCDEEHWHNMNVFLDSSIEGSLNPLVKHVRSKKTLYLCSEKLTEFARKELDVDYVISIPLLNSYLELERIEAEVLQLLENKEIELILMSGGFLTKVLFYRLFVLRQIKINMLDLGSVFDGYVNHASRSHVKQLTKINIEKNLARK